MAIRIPDLGLGDGKTGDTELKIRQDYNHNFSDQANAASRLVGAANGQVPLVEQIPSLLGTAATKNVGTAAGNVMEVGAFGLGAESTINVTASNISTLPSGIYPMNDYAGAPLAYGTALRVVGLRGLWVQNIFFPAGEYFAPYLQTKINDRDITVPQPFLILGRNVTKDANGFLKGASPVIDMYNDKIELNHNAEQQGGIMFEKLGVGDYLIKGSLGFAQEGWYIETPKDANGNVLVAVVYEQLANNDLSIKTYAKKFDDETGDIIANLAKPRDIPTGRFISLRLHELPKGPPVMPHDMQAEV